MESRPSSASTRVLPDAVVRGNQLPLLNILRGCAAAYVALYHCIDLLTVSGRQFHMAGGAVGLLRHGNLLGLFGFGHYAVVLFFLLSGFSIHLRQAQARQNGDDLLSKAWLRPYAVRRSLRIYPPLIVGILITYVLAFLGFRWFPDLYGHPFGHPTGAWLTTAVPNLSNGVTVLFPLLHEQHVGANAVFWSVAFELIFYVLYVPILLYVTKLRWHSLRVLVVVTMAAYLSGVALRSLFGDSQLVIQYSYTLQYLPIWWFGVYLADVYVGGALTSDARRWLPAIGACGVVLASFVSANDFSPELDYVWALALGALMITMLSGSWGAAKVPFLLQQLTASSYSLYLIHMPVLMFMLGVVGRGGKPLTNPFAVFGIWLVCIGVARVVSFSVEQPSQNLARSILRR